jgi:SBP domain
MLCHIRIQVEGCGRELCALTTYHQRCRICEVHIKLPSFMRHGTEQRFCQQCGRCHQLSAFDSGKRSCRAQLQKHNARCAMSSIAYRWFMATVGLTISVCLVARSV